MDALISLNGKQIYWLKQTMERRLITDQACEVIKEYLPFVCENSSRNSSTSGSEDRDRYRVIVGGLVYTMFIVCCVGLLCDHFGNKFDLLLVPSVLFSFVERKM